jgi:endoglucanase
VQAVYNTMCAMQTATGAPWIGATWWAAGPWWGDYFTSVEPTTGDDFTTVLPQALLPFV